jgi:hypothetical protein
MPTALAFGGPLAAIHDGVLSHSGDNVDGSHKLRLVALEQSLNGTHERPTAKDAIGVNQTFNVALIVRNTGKIQTPEVEQANTLSWGIFSGCVELLLDPARPPGGASWCLRRVDEARAR